MLTGLLREVGLNIKDDKVPFTSIDKRRVKFFLRSTGLLREVGLNIKGDKGPLISIDELRVKFFLRSAGLRRKMGLNGTDKDPLLRMVMLSIQLALRGMGLNGTDKDPLLRMVMLSIQLALRGRGVCIQSSFCVSSKRDVHSPPSSHALPSKISRITFFRDFLFLNACVPNSPASTEP
jgi:hypothetical protein